MYIPNAYEFSRKMPFARHFVHAHSSAHPYIYRLRGLISCNVFQSKDITPRENQSAFGIINLIRDNNQNF